MTAAQSDTLHQEKVKKSMLMFLNNTKNQIKAWNLINSFFWKGAKKANLRSWRGGHGVREGE